MPGTPPIITFGSLYSLHKVVVAATIEFFDTRTPFKQVTLVPIQTWSSIIISWDGFIILPSKSKIEWESPVLKCKKEENKQSLNESTNDSKINQDIEVFSKKLTICEKWPFLSFVCTYIYANMHTINQKRG